MPTIRPAPGNVPRRTSFNVKEAPPVDACSAGSQPLPYLARDGGNGSCKREHAAQSERELLAASRQLVQLRKGGLRQHDVIVQAMALQHDHQGPLGKARSRNG